MKVISMNKTPKINIERLSDGEADNLFRVHWWKSIDTRKAIKTLARLRMAGFLTYVQYISLWGERPYLSNKIIFIRLSGQEKIQNKVILLPRQGKINLGKILHTYTNNENIIQKNKDTPGGGNIIFDENLGLEIRDPLGSRWLKPDGIILKDDKIYYIETDLANERKAVLREKWKHYQEYFSQEISKGNMEFNNIKVIFCTTTKKRVERLRKEWIFFGLELLDLIEYSLNY